MELEQLVDILKKQFRITKKYLDDSSPNYKDKLQDKYDETEEKLNELSLMHQDHILGYQGDDIYINLLRKRFSLQVKINYIQKLDEKDMYYEELVEDNNELKELTNQAFEYYYS